MDSIRIDSGVKRIAINNDETRVIEFNPEDVTFAERFYAGLKDIEAMLVDYQRRAAQLDQALVEVDEFGVPANLDEQLQFRRQVCEGMHAAIDRIFGAGTSQTVFQGELNIHMVTQFMDGVTPFIEKTRSPKVGKYSRPKKRGGKQVMRG